MGIGWFSVVSAVLAANDGPEGLANALEGTYDSIVAWYQSKVDEAEAALPDTYEHLAAWLDEKARTEGIKATFTPKQVAKAIGATRIGIGLLDHISDGWIAYDIYNTHPAVKKHKADYHEKRLDEAEAYFIAKLKAEEDAAARGVLPRGQAAGEARGAERRRPAFRRDPGPHRLAAGAGGCGGPRAGRPHPVRLRVNRPAAASA